MIALAIAATIAGSVPQTLTAPSRAIWVDGDPSSQALCRLPSPRGWECEAIIDPSRGLVVIIGENGVAYFRIGGGSGAAVKRWAVW